MTLPNLEEVDRLPEAEIDQLITVARNMELYLRALPVVLNELVAAVDRLKLDREILERDLDRAVEGGVMAVNSPWSDKLLALHAKLDESETLRAQLISDLNEAEKELAAALAELGRRKNYADTVRRQDMELARLRSELAEARAEIERLKKERDIAKSFHDLAVADRNLADYQLSKSREEIERLKRRLSDRDWEGMGPL